MNNPKEQITGVILAGGKGSRMGGVDKGLIKFQGRPLVEHILERVKPQVNEVVINANRNLQKYAGYGVKVVRDEQQESQGPLAGIASAMAITTTPLLLTTPCDSPFLPINLAQRLYLALTDNDVDLAVANTGKLQPVFCLVKTDLRNSLMNFMAGGGRKIDLWYNQIRYTSADFSDIPECFTNINTPQDMKKIIATES